MKTIELDEVCNAPTRYHLEIKLVKGIEMEREVRYPRASAERIWVTSVSGGSRKTVFGIVVQLRPRGRRLAIVNKCKPMAFLERERAEKIARWISNPVATRNEWDHSEGGPEKDS